MPYIGRMGGTQDASANQQHTIPSNMVIGAWVAEFWFERVLGGAAYEGSWMNIEGLL